MSNNTFNALHVDTTGWNGQLPMLDLYYLVKRLTENGPALTLSQVAKQILQSCQLRIPSSGCSLSSEAIWTLLAGCKGAFFAAYIKKSASLLETYVANPVLQLAASHSFTNWNTCRVCKVWH